MKGGNTPKRHRGAEGHRNAEPACRAVGLAQAEGALHSAFETPGGYVRQAAVAHVFRSGLK
jgi:hypothetical protein